MSPQHLNCPGLWCFHANDTPGRCRFSAVSLAENWFICANSLHTPCDAMRLLKLNRQEGYGHCFGWFIQDLFSTLSQCQKNSLTYLDQMLFSSKRC